MLCKSSGWMMMVMSNIEWIGVDEEVVVCMGVGNDGWERERERANHEKKYMSKW